ncbi:MAG: Tim44-like domain-containing protein [Hydrogenophilus sp.]|nr:Tim44-like domain-containing protein [Hydrogenophilus sp.]
MWFRRLLFFALSGAVFLNASPIDAKRLGGGGNVGLQRSAPTVSKSSPSPHSPQAAPSPAPFSAASPSSATAPPSAAGRPASPTPSTAPPSSSPSAPSPAPTAPPPASSGGWLAPLAGIAAGLGLAALFSTLGIGAEIGILLLLLLSGLFLFFLFRLFAQRLSVGRPAPAAPSPLTREISLSDSSSLSSFNPNSSATSPASHARTPAGAPPSLPPVDLDRSAFLAEAKRNFIALQAAHDARDWNTIERLVTPELAEALRRQPSLPSRTEILQLSADLLDLTAEEGQILATILFTGLIREEPDAPPTPFREQWHLLKSAPDAGWRLAGIEQS